MNSWSGWLGGARPGRRNRREAAGPGSGVKVPHRLIEAGKLENPLVLANNRGTSPPQPFAPRRLSSERQCPPPVEPTQAENPPPDREQARRRTSPADDDRLQHPLRDRRSKPGRSHPAASGPSTSWPGSSGWSTTSTRASTSSSGTCRTHESDHVLNIAYNLLAGGSRLEHLEVRRNDEVYLDALGAATHPRPDHRRGLLPPLHRGRFRLAQVSFTFGVINPPRDLARPRTPRRRDAPCAGSSRAKCLAQGVTRSCGTGVSQPRRPETRILVVTKGNPAIMERAKGGRDLGKRPGPARSRLARPPQGAP